MTIVVENKFWKTWCSAGSLFREEWFHNFNNFFLWTPCAKELFSTTTPCLRQPRFDDQDPIPTSINLMAFQDDVGNGLNTFPWEKGNYEPEKAIITSAACITSGPSATDAVDCRPTDKGPAKWSRTALINRIMPAVLADVETRKPNANKRRRVGGELSSPRRHCPPNQGALKKNPNGITEGISLFIDEIALDYVAFSVSRAAMSLL